LTCMLCGLVQDELRKQGTAGMLSALLLPKHA
jgi:hypothetical protein